MHATTDPADSLIPAMSLDSPSDNAMTALYRVALGPVNRDYYLEVFAHFDATGRTTTRWNWAASLCTLNWMVFRQVWSAALVYVAAAEGLALLAFAFGRQFLNWPPGVVGGLVLAFGLLAFAVPGLYGNALLHADIRRRIARALAASRTVPEACALLDQRASTRQRLQWLVAGNVALGALLLAASLLLPREGFQAEVEPTMAPAVTVAQAAASAASAAQAAAPQAASSAPVAPRPVAPAASAAAASAAEAAPAPAAPAPLPAPSPAASSPPQTSREKSDESEKGGKAPATQASAPAAPATQPAAARPAADAAPSPAPRAKERPARAAVAAPPAAPKASAASASSPSSSSSASSSSPAQPASAASAAAGAASAELPTVGSTPGYYINVGLFADEANARKAQARLLNEGLPAFRQELNSAAKGRRIRVRTGPYASRAQADAAAQTIRAMGLEAVVFKQ